jgi:hypothetical protein
VQRDDKLMTMVRNNTLLTRVSSLQFASVSVFMRIYPTYAHFSVKKALYECLPYKSSTGAVDGNLGVLGDLEAFR